MASPLKTSPPSSIWIMRLPAEVMQLSEDKFGKLEKELNEQDVDFKELTHDGTQGLSPWKTNGLFKTFKNNMSGPSCFCHSVKHNSVIWVVGPHDAAEHVDQMKMTMICGMDRAPWKHFARHLPFQSVFTIYGGNNDVDATCFKIRNWGLLPTACD